MNLAPSPLPQKNGGIPLASAVDSVLLGYQKRWIMDERCVKFCRKTRRCGLSWGEASDCTLLAAKATGMDTWYIGYTKDMAMEFIRDCGDWARHYNLAAGEIEETEEIFLEGKETQSILAFRITFASGWRITALSSVPSNLRGKQGRVVVDEAAFVKSLKAIMKAAIALLMWGGQVHVISTHNGVDSEFNEIIQEIEAGKKPYGLHTVTLDDAIADGLYQRICLVTGREWTPASDAAWRAEMVAYYGTDADEELFCIPSMSGGKYLSLVLIEARMNPDVPVLRYSCKQGHELLPDEVRETELNEWLEKNVLPLLDRLDQARKSYYGMDFGRVADLSSIMPGILGADLVRRVPFLVELFNVPFKQQEQALFYIVDRLPGFMAGKNDAGGNGAYVAEVAKQRYGAERIEEVKLSEKWYAENFPPMKAALEEGSFTDLPRHEGVRDDFRCIEKIRGTPRIPDKRTKDKDGDKEGATRHGDSAVAGVLMYAASCTEVSPIEFMSGGAKRLGYQLNDFVGRYDG